MNSYYFIVSNIHVFAQSLSLDPRSPSGIPRTPILVEDDSEDGENGEEREKKNKREKRKKSRWGLALVK